MKRKALTEADVEAAVDSVIDNGLIRWYQKWGESPWDYAFIDPLVKAPLLLLFWLLIRWKSDTQLLLGDPGSFLAQRWPYLVAIYLTAVFLKRWAWKQKAFEYCLKAEWAEGFTKPASDGPLVQSARTSIKKVPARFSRWGRSRARLMILCTVLTPVSGILPLYAMNAWKAGSFSWHTFINLFEGGLALFMAVAAIFALFGLGLGYALWKQIVANHHLLQLHKTNLGER
jgi:hypothetical protein